MADKDDFWEHYKHPLWQAKRLEILQRDKFTCRECRSTEKELHIHHKAYVKGQKPWEYNDDNFVTLCKTCHEYVTSNIKEIRFFVGHLSLREIRIALGFCFGLYHQRLDKPYQHVGSYAWAGHCLSYLSELLLNNLDEAENELPILWEDQAQALVLEAYAARLRGGQ